MVDRSLAGVPRVLSCLCPISPVLLLCLHPSHSHPAGVSGSPGCLQSWGEGPWNLGGTPQALTSCLTPKQIKVEFSMKFTSRDMSLKRTPSKKQTGVFGVKISVVTK